MTFHATTPLTANELRTAVLTAKRQEDAVLAIYGARSFPMGPWDVHAIGVAHGRRWLIGSVRRAVTNLASAGKLAKTEQLAHGPAGARVHLWERAAA